MGDWIRHFSLKFVKNSLIDTIGFDDPNNDTDANIISELVLKLKQKCDHVNLFLIAVNGQNPRLDGALVGMIRIFEVSVRNTETI